MHRFSPHDELVHVGRLRFEGLTPRKSAQPVRERGGPLCRGLGGRYVSIDVPDPALPYAGLHHLEAAGDPGQQVVEIMG